MIANKNKNPNAVVRTPQFPGGQFGADIAKVREIIKKQKRIKGFQFSLTIGDNPDLNIDISGTAKIMLGIVLFNNKGITADPASDASKVTFRVNNEIIIDSVHSALLGNEYMDDEYYFIPRPLSGQDDIKITFNGVLADYEQFMGIYYL